jgi:hypothetical protein
MDQLLPLPKSTQLRQRGASNEGGGAPRANACGADARVFDTTSPWASLASMGPSARPMRAGKGGAAMQSIRLGLGRRLSAPAPPAAVLT